MDDAPAGPGVEVTRSGLEQRVLARLRRLNLPARSTILVGFSGGGDSLALAAVLARLAPVADVEIVLAHVDHRLRPESGGDAERVIELGAELGLRTLVERLEAGLPGRAAGLGVEEAARRERYLALSRVGERVGAAVIALAHQRDDQAETVLLHLLRGAGVSGAAGMAEQVERRVPWWDESGEPARHDRFWRPLLTESRATLRAYLADRGFEPVADRSNADESFRRNAVRSRVLPAMEAVWPEAAAALARYAALAAEEDAALDDLAGAALAQSLRAGGALAISDLARQPVAIQRRALRAWLAARGVREAGAERVEAARDLMLRGEARRFVEVGRGIGVARVGETLRAGRLADIVGAAEQNFPGPLAPPSDVAFELPLAEARGGSAGLPAGWVLRVDQGVDHRSTEPDHASGRIVCRLPARVLREGRVRRLRPDDRWAGNGRTLRDWLRRRRVSPWVRHRLLGVVTAEGVWCVLGLASPEGIGVPDEAGAARVWIERAGEGAGMDEPRAWGVARVLIGEQEIQDKIRELARELDAEYRDEPPLMVGVLTGAVTFMTDLMRAMTVPVTVDFMAVSSYGDSTRTSGVVRILKDLNQEIEGRRLLVVEDIVDSGLTLQYLLDVLRRRNPADLRVVALLKKEKPDAVEVQVDHLGFAIPDEFVVGYGLDYAGRYRNLPYVAILDPSVISES